MTSHPDILRKGIKSYLFTCLLPQSGHILDIERSTAYVLTPDASATYHTPLPSLSVIVNYSCSVSKCSWYDVVTVLLPLLIVFACVGISPQPPRSLDHGVTLAFCIRLLKTTQTTPFVTLHRFLTMCTFPSGLISPGNIANSSVSSWSYSCSQHLRVYGGGSLPTKVKSHEAKPPTFHSSPAPRLVPQHLEMEMSCQRISLLSERVFRKNRYLS